MQTVPIYGVIVGFTLGIFIRSFFSIGLPWILWIFCIGLALCLVSLKKKNTRAASLLLLLSLCLCSFSLGLLRMDREVHFEENPHYQSQLDTVLSEEGIIVREPDIRASSQHLYVKVNNELLLVTTDRYVDVSYGDKVSFTGKLAKPTSFETDIGRTFNYQGYLNARGVHYVVSFAKVTVIEQNQASVILKNILEFKHLFMRNIEAVLPEPYAGLGEGLLLGVKQALGKDIEASFRTTGIIHIVVLSGYNIMLVVLFVMYLLALFLPMRLRLVCGALSILLFAILVGLSPTVMRASAMALLLLLSQATERTYVVLRALVLTGFFMLILNPYLLVYDVGFQFSFIATLGLILVSPHLAFYVRFMPTWFKLREFLTATLATQIFITPILLYQMGQLSVVAVFVNLLVLPMVPVAMVLIFITGMVGFISTTLSSLVGYMAYMSLAYIILIAEVFAKLPFASYVVPAFPFYVVVIVYFLYALILWRLYVKASRPGRPLISKSHDWTVVEEQTLVPVTLKSTFNDTPIFFR